MKNILVTGGAGYIGSTTAKELNKRGYNPICVDNLMTGSRYATKFGKFFLVDIKDTFTIYKILKEYAINSVIHFAASLSVGESVTDPLKYYENNVSNMVSLLKAMKLAGSSNIVMSSSAAVYGISSDGTPITEDKRLNPINPYGNTKKIMEEIAMDFSISNNINYASLRYFNVCGADAQLDTGWYKSTNLVAVLADCIYNDKVLSVFGGNYDTPDGTCIRDYVHVSDLAVAHINALEYIKSGESLTINLGTKRGTSVLEIITTMEKILDKKINYKIVDRREGDPAILIADCKLAEKLIEWNPKHNIKDMLDSSYKWYGKYFAKLNK